MAKYDLMMLCQLWSSARGECESCYEIEQKPGKKYCVDDMTTVILPTCCFSQVGDLNQEDAIMEEDNTQDATHMDNICPFWIL